MHLVFRYWRKTAAEKNGCGTFRAEDKIIRIWSSAFLLQRLPGASSSLSDSKVTGTAIWVHRQVSNSAISLADPNSQTICFIGVFSHFFIFSEKFANKLLLLSFFFILLRYNISTNIISCRSITQNKNNVFVLMHVGKWCFIFDK